jgi:hypothetical protein
MEIKMKVWPLNEDKRRLLAHPTAGGFRETGSTEWPDDSWTYRRIRDGDVTTEEPKEEKAKAVKADKVKE